MTVGNILFVVAGYPAIGLGHIYRSLMLAGEMKDFKVSFLYTRESGAYVADHLAAAHFPAFMQQSDSLWRDVLALRPDLVINDMLDTGTDYMLPLKQQGLRLVNFEDEGPGAALADIVVNALYGRGESATNLLYGHENFCLRDEFLKARRNLFRPKAERLLITFGGTDFSDFTRQSVDAIFEDCRRDGLSVRVVAGPGYAHKQALLERIEFLDPGQTRLSFTYATNIMSKEMENADFAVCSAGRTVYELAHMRIPGIVLAHHKREDMHRFARPENGFMYLGVMNPFRAADLRAAFRRMQHPEERLLFRNRLEKFDFTGNKTSVVNTIIALLRVPGG
jgi:spore coat polysaccharide biosynthesis predicted glycosyltransferase SpsG